MLKRLLIGLSLLVGLSLVLVTVGMPIAPAIAESELDRMIREAEAELKGTEQSTEAAEEVAAEGFLDLLISEELTKGKVQEAIDSLNKFRKRYPNSVYSYRKMGEIKEEYQQDLPGAFKEYEQAFIKAQQKKDEDEIVRSANAAVNVLLIVADISKDAQAFSLAHKLMASIKSYRRTPEGDVNLARGAEILLLQKKMTAKETEALKQQTQQRFDQVIKARPKSAYAYLYRGIFRARILNDSAGAQADLQLANELARSSGWKAGIDRSSAALRTLSHTEAVAQRR